MPSSDRLADQPTVSISVARAQTHATNFLPVSTRSRTFTTPTVTMKLTRVINPTVMGTTRSTPKLTTTPTIPNLTNLRTPRMMTMT